MSLKSDALMSGPSGNKILNGSFSRNEEYQDISRKPIVLSLYGFAVHAALEIHPYKDFYARVPF
jgi:hypothetical protein